MFTILIGISLVILVGTEVIHIHILNGILAIIALVIILVAFTSKDYNYLFRPIMNNKGRNLVLNENEAFILSSSGTAILKREGEYVYASAFVKIPLYKSSTEMNKEEKLDISRLFSRILTLSKNPIKLSSQLYVINKDEYIARLRSMLNETEDKYRTIQNLESGQSTSALERVRGELSMWRNILDSVSKSHSQSLILYAMVSGLGNNEEEATNIAYQRAEELAGGISTILGVDAYIATGEDILTLVEPEYMIPQETVSERIRQKTIGDITGS